MIFGGSSPGNRYAPAMPFGIGIWELLILLLVLLLVFGPKRLPEMGRQLGKGMREFKDSVSGSEKDLADDPHTVDEVAELPPADSATTSAAPARERDTVS
jgi:sec-independent protein translocase protein TatA